MDPNIRLYNLPEEPMLAPTMNFRPEEPGDNDDGPLVAPTMNFDPAPDDPWAAPSWPGGASGPSSPVQNKLDQWGYLVPDDGEGPLLPPVWVF